ncbi:HlyD family type I secretion periplasmic adaptor subunit [Microbaculum marinum]|uniref:Membrane fusion protein (MFP) family protein n=1 Tax=Microbaculum marinum TaxID=1764581 RepID=A0AAW9REJ2_9HYPH
MQVKRRKRARALDRPTIDLSVEKTTKSDDGVGRIALYGGLTALSFLMAIVIWASTMHVASASVASGRVTVEGSRKAIQHRDGGPVESVLVHEGEKVSKGQPLVVLDLSDERAQESVYSGLRIQYLARVARLEAEAAERETVEFPAALVDSVDDDPRIAAMMQQEKDIFHSKLGAHEGKISLLQQQIEGAKSQIAALNGSMDATQRQLELIKDEITEIQPLVEKGLITRPRILALARTEAELESTIEQVNASLSEQKSMIDQATISIAQLNKDRLETTNKELGEARAQLSDVEPKLKAIRERLARGTLVAPVDGYIYNLTVFGPGAAIVPGQTVMEIVPSDVDLVLSVEIPVNSIDDVRPGQTVIVHLLAYQQRYQFQIYGTLKSISSDEMEDPDRQWKYYRGTVTVDPEDVARNGAELIPGMPVTTMIRTGDRTIMAYLLDPLTRMYEFAFRES